MSTTNAVGQIILPQAPTPTEPAPIKILGSPITAAARTVSENTEIQQKAVQTLGGKMTGGADVEVKNIPHVPSAGNSDPSAVFGKMMELKAISAEQGKYDSLGSAQPMNVGGKRKSKKHNARRVNRRTRRHRRASLKRGGVHHTRRRVRTRSGKKTHKK
jgi:hypothetical protein